VTLASSSTASCRCRLTSLRSVEAATTSCASCGRLSGRCLKMRVRQAFVSCRLDYCNSLFFGISERLMNRLQSVQNAAACLVTGTRRSDHISPVLRQLHWLPVRQRVDFKVVTLVHQSLSVISPPYLADVCRLVADAHERRLRSTVSRTCAVTQTYSTFGDRAFGAAGPGLWNSLPWHLKDADISYCEFRRSLKTFLFGQWGHGAV